MKRLKILTIVLSLILLSMCIIPVCYATEIQPRVETEADETNPEVMPISEEGTEVPVTEGENAGETSEGEEEYYEGDLYEMSSSDDYIMDKQVIGNVFLAGKNITITGAINGSLYIFATDKVVIDEQAYVNGQVFIYANTVEMKGLVIDLYCACTNYRNTTTSLVYRDLRLAAQDTYLAGGVGRDVFINTQKIAAETGEENPFIVYGNLEYKADNEIEGMDRTSVKGDIKYNKVEAYQAGEANTVAAYVGRLISTIIFDLFAYIFIITFAPRFTSKVKDYISSRGILALVVGLLFAVLVPIVSIAALISGTLSACGLLWFIVFALVCMLNAAVVAIAITQLIISKMKVEKAGLRRLIIIPVSAVLWGIKQIPVVGAFIAIAIYLLGVGIITLYQFDRIKEDKAVKAE